MIAHAVNTAFRKKNERGWTKYPRMFWAIDLHDVIIPGTYTRTNEGRQFYPDGKEVLQWLTNRKDMCLILYTSSHIDAINDILIWLKQWGIIFDHVNKNPECEDTNLCSFKDKFYMDVMLEDKAGFNGNNGWIDIKNALIELGEWEKKLAHNE
jgi:hypothetical protein